MTTGNTTLLGLALPVEGELDGTWGDVVNDSITSLLDSAVAGTTTLSADADVTLTTTVLSANQARQAIILWTASNGATTRNITAPARSKAYVVINAGTGSIVLRGVGPTAGVTIVSGERCLAAWNGSDFVKIATSTADGVTTISFGSTGLTPATATSGAVTVAGTLAIANGGTGATTNTAARTNLGATTLGANLFTVANPSAVTFPRFNADNTVSSLDAASFRTAIGAGSGGGSVTSVSGTGTVNGISLSGTVTTSGSLTLGGALSGVSLTTQVTGTLPIANGGTGTTSTTFANLTTNVTGTLPVGNGGTGTTSLTANNVLLGNGTSALQVVAPGTDGNVLTASGGTWVSSTPAAGVSLAADNTWTGTQTFAGTSSKLAVVLNDAAETTTVSATAATGTINFDVTTQSVLYYTSSSSGNWTLNVRASSGTSLDAVMSTGQSVTIAFLVTNGATAYYQTGFQVDGSSVTPKWQGGTAPTSGNANSIDTYVITVIKTGSATFTVLASQTRFA
jgi:hypothetical protein